MDRSLILFLIVSSKKTYLLKRNPLQHTLGAGELEVVDVALHCHLE